MNISILGYPWEVLVLNVETFKFHYGSDCEGITNPAKQQLVFREDCITQLHIAHELTHAFKYYCAVEGIKFDDDDTAEEFWCDFIGLHGESIMTLTKQILKDLSNG